MEEQIIKDSTIIKELINSINNLYFRKSEYELYLRLINEKDPILSGLMAVQAFNFNRDYDGFKLDAKIFEGMYLALNRLGLISAPIQVKEKLVLENLRKVSSDSVINLEKGISASLKNDIVRVWSIHNVNRIPIMIRSNGKIESISFYQNGDTLKLLNKRDSSYELELWSLNPEQMAKRICEKTQRNFTFREWDLNVGPLQYQKTCPSWPYNKD